MPGELIFRQITAPPAERLFPTFVGRRYPFFLDSGMGHERLGRYSFMGADPFLVVRSWGRVVEIEAEGERRRVCADPFDVLEDLLKRHTLPKGDYPVPFVGGAVGYLAYDLGRLIERLPNAPPDDLGLPEAFLCFYDALMAYDHALGSTYVVSTGLPEPPGAGRRARAERRLAEVEALAVGRGESHSAGAVERGIVGATGQSPLWGITSSPLAPLMSTFTREAYLAAVRRAREYLIAGDCYQVNLSQRFQAPWAGTAWELHQRVRSRHPAPFAAFLDFGRFAVVSASPERFLRVRGDLMETRPIKGTRPRGRTPEEDVRLERALLASVKDRAEHIMIVDLERNDLGRVAQIGSVRVDELMALERYATVHHLVSTVRGRLRPDRGVADLVRATFPGGSVTGAPKVRAMQIIDELEPVRRGVYTGAIGYFSAAGELDLNIAIRTLVLKDGVAYFHVGGGIVYDSEPEAEYQETLDKGQAFFEVLTGAAPVSVRPMSSGRGVKPSGSLPVEPETLDTIVGTGAECGR